MAINFRNRIAGICEAGPLERRPWWMLHFAKRFWNGMSHRNHSDPRWSRVDLRRMMLGTTRPGISCQGMAGTWEFHQVSSPLFETMNCYSEILALSLPCHARNVTSSTPMPSCHPPGPAMSRAQGLCRACIDPTPSAEGRHHWYLPWEIQWCRCCSGTKLASCLDKQFLFVSKINVRSLRKSLEWKSAPHSIQNWVYILGSGQGISDNRTVQVTFGSREFGISGNYFVWWMTVICYFHSSSLRSQTWECSWGG